MKTIKNAKKSKTKLLAPGLGIRIHWLGNQPTQEAQAERLRLCKLLGVT